jgi:hypothetical protein
MRCTPTHEATLWRRGKGGFASSSKTVHLIVSLSGLALLPLLRFLFHQQHLGQHVRPSGRKRRGKDADKDFWVLN